MFVLLLETSYFCARKTNVCDVMTLSDIFTDDERRRTFDILHELFVMAADVIKEGDEAKLTHYIERAVERALLRRDCFGLNPIVTDAETALLVCGEIGLSRGSVLGVLLNALVESGSITIDEVRRDFGEDTAVILHGLMRIREVYAKSATVGSENFRSLLVTFAEDMRVILIMIANRICVMRQIRDTENVEERRKMAMEAAYLYAPLAHKLGLYQLKSELEDLSLKYLEHDAYYHIKEMLSETKRSRDAYIERFIKPLDEKLKAAGLHYHMKGRTKSIHSIWQKMQKQQVDVDGVFDLFAIRIILQSPPEREKMECWQVFSIVTDMYQSNPKRMRDWLSVPKSNGYESLHITVLGPEQKWVEVQIRTERMDDIAEHGLAAHWRYKGIKTGQSGVEEWLAGVRSALETNDDAMLMDQFRLDLKEDEVFVFTPKGDIFKLPLGATVLDFAYHIHSNVGNRCVGARIGGKNVTIRQKLQSGDQVEILTSSNQTPKRDWLGIVTTTRARAKVRQCLKEMEAGQALLAKEELERKMKNRKLDFEEPVMMHTMTKLGYRIVTEFYAALSDGKLDMNAVLEAYAQQQRFDHGEAEKTIPAQSADAYVMQEKASTQKGNAEGADVLVIEENLKGLDFQMAKCCHPVYGDEVFGFVTSGGGIKIHREDCPNAPQLRQRFGYRIVKAKWAGKRGSQYPITLRVVGNDDIGIVNNITNIISKEEKILLRSISIDTSDGLFYGTLTVMLDDLGRLQQLIKKLGNVRGVKNVSRS